MLASKQRWEIHCCSWKTPRFRCPGASDHDLKSSNKKKRALALSAERLSLGSISTRAVNCCQKPIRRENIQREATVREFLWYGTKAPNKLLWSAWVMGKSAHKVKFQQAGSLNYHNWRPQRWGRIWQSVQNVIWWSPSAMNNRPDVWLCMTLVWAEWQVKFKSAISFLGVFLRKDRQVSTLFIVVFQYRVEYFQVVNHETTACDPAPEVREDILKNDQKLSSVSFVNL